MMTKSSDSTNRVDLVGRAADYNDHDGEVRAQAPLMVSASVRERGGVDVIARAQLFRSSEDFDRGGVVIRIGLRSITGGGFKPWARMVNSGVEIHVAGDAESEAVVAALRALLSLPENSETHIENRKGVADPPKKQAP